MVCNILLLLAIWGRSPIDLAAVISNMPVLPKQPNCRWYKKIHWFIATDCLKLVFILFYYLVQKLQNRKKSLLKECSIIGGLFSFIFNNILLLLILMTALKYNFSLAWFFHNLYSFSGTQWTWTKIIDHTTNYKAEVTHRCKDIVNWWVRLWIAISRSFVPQSTVHFKLGTINVELLLLCLAWLFMLKCDFRWESFF